MFLFEIVNDADVITYFKRAKEISNRSPCTRKKVGAVLFKNATFVDGYNYPAYRADDVTVDNDNETLSDVVHAEMDIITKLASKYHGFISKDSSIISTLSPCIQCAKNIIRLGIKDFYFRDIHHVRPLVLLMASNINVYQIVEVDVTTTKGSDVAIKIETSHVSTLYYKCLNNDPAYKELIKLCNTNPKVFLSQTA